MSKPLCILNIALLLCVCNFAWAASDENGDANAAHVPADVDACALVLIEPKITGRGELLAAALPMSPESWAATHAGLYEALTQLDTKLFQGTQLKDYMPLNLAKAYRVALELRSEITGDLKAIAHTLPPLSKARHEFEAAVATLDVETLPRTWVDLPLEKLNEIVSSMEEFLEERPNTVEARSQNLIYSIFNDVIYRKNAEFVPSKNSTHGPFHLVLQPIFQVLGDLLLATWHPSISAEAWSIVQTGPQIFENKNLAPRWRLFTHLVPAEPWAWAYQSPLAYYRVAHLEQTLSENYDSYKNAQTAPDLIKTYMNDVDKIMTVLRTAKYSDAKSGPLRNADFAVPAVNKILASIQRGLIPQAWLEASTEQLNQLISEHQSLFESTYATAVKGSIQNKIFFLQMLSDWSVNNTFTSNEREVFTSRYLGHLRSYVNELLVALRLKKVTHMNVTIEDIVKNFGVSRSEFFFIRRLIRQLNNTNNSNSFNSSIYREIDIIAGTSHPVWVEVKALSKPLDLRTSRSDKLAALLNQLSSQAVLQEFLRNEIQLSRGPINIISKDTNRISLYLPMGITNEAANFLHEKLAPIMTRTKTTFEIVGPRIPLI